MDLKEVELRLGDIKSVILSLSNFRAHFPGDYVSSKITCNFFENTEL